MPWFPIAYFGILKAGAAVVPLNVLLKPREIAYHLKDSDAKAMLVFEGTAELPLARDGARGLRPGGVRAPRRHDGRSRGASPGRRRR